MEAAWRQVWNKMRSTGALSSFFSPPCLPKHWFSQKEGTGVSEAWQGGWGEGHTCHLQTPRDSIPGRHKQLWGSVLIQPAV